MDHTENQENFYKSFHPFKERENPRALNTLLSNEYRMIARYVALVDSKANIMIRLNSMIISGLIVFFKIIDQFTTAEIIVLFIFVITTVTSLAFATMAARPIPLKKRNKVHTSENITEHLFNVQRFDELTKEAYEVAFDTMMRDQSLIYKNMAKELFLGNKVLVMKFERLRYSYNIFLLGIGLTAVIFIITRVITHF